MASPKKRGEGTSCHHCKKRIRPNEMLKCTRGEIVPTNSRKRKRPCVKKYCLHCIKTFYSTQYLDDNSSGSFICPACREECRCAACRRRVMKARLKNDGSALENEADGEANSILESQTPDATNIEEGQVNGLLEILDSRPDVQDIIRRGMAMDFADDNAKILYVGHLIDQALTRPDVLALYYASSHGRTNNISSRTNASLSSSIKIENNKIASALTNLNKKNNKKNLVNDSETDDEEEEEQTTRRRGRGRGRGTTKGRGRIEVDDSEEEEDDDDTDDDDDDTDDEDEEEDDDEDIVEPKRKRYRRSHNLNINQMNNENENKTNKTLLRSMSIPKLPNLSNIKQEPITKINRNSLQINRIQPTPATMSLSGINSINFGKSIPLIPNCNLGIPVNIPFRQNDKQNGNIINNERETDGNDGNLQKKDNNNNNLQFNLTPSAMSLSHM